MPPVSTAQKKPKGSASKSRPKHPIPKSDPEQARPRVKRVPGLASTRRGFFDLDQAPPSIKLIEQWCLDYSAELGRKGRDGSYDAQADFYRRDGFPEDDAFTQAEKAAADVPGPAGIRFVVSLPPIEEKEPVYDDDGSIVESTGGDGPKRYQSEDGGSSIIHGPIAREYNWHKSMARVWEFRDELYLDTCQLQVHWPSAKSERKRGSKR